jgi:hypothetical protein
MAYAGEGRRPLNIFLVNETDQTLEFCDPKCEWGQEGIIFSFGGENTLLTLCDEEGTPMVKHDRFKVEPNQSCVVFARENDLILGTSPVGPKGAFGMRLSDSGDHFSIHYNHPLYALPLRTTLWHLTIFEFLGWAKQPWAWSARLASCTLSATRHNCSNQTPPQ